MDGTGSLNQSYWSDVEWCQQLLVARATMAQLPKGLTDFASHFRAQKERITTNGHALSYIWWAL